MSDLGGSQLAVRPRVTVVATRAYPDVGGIESHVDQLLTRISRDEWDVDVVVTDCTGKLAARDEIHGFPARRHTAFPRTHDWYLSPGLLVDLARRRRDLIHIHGVNALVPPLAMLAAIASRTPFVVTFHSGGANTSLRKRLRALQWRLLGVLLRRATALIAVSQSEHAVFSDILPGHAISVIPNGSFDLPPVTDVVRDPDVVLTIGRLERYKGHHRVIESLVPLLKLRPSARVRVLGTGPYEDELRRIAHGLGIADRVTVTSVPPGDRAAMAREMASAGVVALASDYEAHPVVVTEAVSVGCPVVARRNSGFVELIDEKLIAGVPDDVDAVGLADALHAAMSGGPRPIPVLPTWESCVANVESVYRMVLPPIGTTSAVTSATRVLT